MYHEEMLKQSPRQQLFNDYARQLMRRYPQLKQEIVSRLSHVNEQWTEVMNGLVLPPGVGCHDTSTMLIGNFYSFLKLTICIRCIDYKNCCKPFKTQKDNLVNGRCSGACCT